MNFWQDGLSLSRVVARFSLLSPGISHRRVPCFAQIVTVEYFSQNTSIKPCNKIPPMLHIQLHLNANIIRTSRSGMQTNSNNLINIEERCTERYFNILPQNSKL